MATQENYSNIYVAGNEDDGYVVYYTNLNGMKTYTNLDAQTYDEAKSEAASLLDIEESEVGDE